MNFLAHLYLSGNSTELMIGNFIGDSVKGKDYEKYDNGIIEGIKLHRKIDEFTDSNEVVFKSKIRLRPNYHKYAGVIVDIFYDHFLAANWTDYSPMPLNEYAQSVYDIMTDNIENFPERIKRMLPYIISGNWLEGYAKIDGIDRALKGMATRTKFRSNMEHAAGDLKKDYHLYESEFKAFFPELIKYVNSHHKIITYSHGKI